MAEPETDPLELCVAPERFEEQIRLLRSLGDVVRLSDLLKQSRRARFAVTFDDGYADNASAAAPVLREHDAPATVFAVAEAIGGGPFWWDRLAALLLGRPLPPTLELRPGNRAVTVDVRSPAGRQRAYWTAWSRLRLLSPAQIGEELDRLAATLGEPVTDARAMTGDELRGLEAHGVEVGGHTLTHPSLPALDAEAQRREIEGGRTRLEELLGRRVDTFAYPYGEHDASAVRAVRNAGFHAACTVHEGAVSSLSSRLLLPRFAVRDWDADELERRLSGRR